MQTLLCLFYITHALFKGAMLHSNLPATLRSFPICMHFLFLKRYYVVISDQNTTFPSSRLNFLVKINFADRSVSLNRTERAQKSILRDALSE